MVPFRDTYFDGKSWNSLGTTNGLTAQPKIGCQFGPELTSNWQHYVSIRRSQDNLFICLNLYIRTNSSDPYVLRHWIYWLYLTVEQSWVGVISQ